MIDPSDPDNAVIVVLPGYPSGGVVVADGRVYQTIGYGDTRCMLTIDPADPTNHPTFIDVPGSPNNQPRNGVLAADGRVYQTTYSYGDDGIDHFTTHVTAIDPADPDHPVDLRPTCPAARIAAVWWWPTVICTKPQPPSTATPLPASGPLT